MDDIIYNLLLKSSVGLTLLGTLRYRFTDLDALTEMGNGKREDGIAGLMAEALQRPTVVVALFQLEGTLSIPLLSGLRAIPLQGLAFATPAGPVTTLLSSTDPQRGAGLQFNLLDNRHVAGGLSWRSGEPGELVFSVLGTQLAPAA